MDKMVFPVRTYFIEPQKKKEKQEKTISKEEQEAFDKAVKKAYKQEKVIKASGFHSNAMSARNSTREICEVCGKEFEANSFGRRAKMCYMCRRIPPAKRVKKVE